MAEERALRTRALSLTLLVLSNVFPAVLSLMNKPWAIPPAVFFGGNAIWIAQGFWRPDRSDTGTRGSAARTWAPCLLMSVGALAWAWVSQPAVTLHDGLAWDGLHYASMYSYFRQGVFTAQVPEFPYAQRVGLPYLAAHIPLPPRQAFFLLHAVFWSAAMVLFAAGGRLWFGLRSVTIQYAVLWLQVLWVSIPRAAASSSYMVDSAAVFFIELWVFLLVSGRWRWLLPVCALTGVFFKETMLIVVVLSTVTLLAMRFVPRWRRLLPDGWRTLSSPVYSALLASTAAAAIGKWSAAHVLGLTSSPIFELRIVQHWIWVRRLNLPLYLSRYLAAVFAAYGGFAIVAAATFGCPRTSGRDWRFVATAAMCPTYLAICFFGGSDMTRFAFLAFPFALPILLARFEDVVPAVGVTGLLFGLPAAHLLAPIASPAPGREMPAQNIDGPYSWVMEYAHPSIVSSWIAWWLFSILVVLWLHRQSRAPSYAVLEARGAE